MTKPYQPIDDNVFIDYYNNILSEDYKHYNLSQKQKDKFDYPYIEKINKIKYENIVVRVDFILTNGKIIKTILFYEKLDPYIINNKRKKILDAILNDN